MKREEPENKVMEEKFTFLKRIFATENRWGICIGLIVVVVVYLSDYLLPTQQLISYILQALTVIIIPTVLSTIIGNYQRETIKSATEEALNKIENKYKKISCNSTNLFKIFQLNDIGNFCNVAHNIFFNHLTESYSRNSEKRKYYVPIDTYYEIIKGFLRIGYRIKTINGMLLPFWYVPREKDDALASYTSFCKDNAELYQRVTYYQDYKDDSWRDNTVKMIYLDLLSSEKSDDVAVRWLITLIATIEELRTIFGSYIEKILGKRLENINYLQLRDIQFNQAIRNNIETVTKLLDEQYQDDSGNTISSKMTAIIEELFLKDMKGKNNFVKKSIIDAKFNEFTRNMIDFEDVTEVGYYYRDKDKDDDQFVIFLNGSNTGPSVELEIITEKDKIAKIQPILDALFKKNKE